MCGLAGFFDASRSLDDNTLSDIALRMADTLRHRGPDDRGAWSDAGAGIALGFRRLSIVDLSPAELLAAFDRLVRTGKVRAVGALEAGLRLKPPSLL